MLNAYNIGSIGTLNNVKYIHVINSVIIYTVLSINALPSKVNVESFCNFIFY